MEGRLARIPRSFVWLPAILWLLGGGACFVSPLHAQVPDTTGVLSPDTVAVDTTGTIPSDTLRRPLWPPVGFRRTEPGRVVSDTLGRLASLDVQGVLAAIPASFVYDFGTPGWPDGWSPYGLDPQRVALLLDGLPFDDPLTGRPRYDLLPFAFLDPLRVQPGRHGISVAVQGHLRAYNSPQPLTELRYWTSQTGLQSIMAMHAQQRRRALFGRAGQMSAVFGFGGHTADGEYPGSRLRRMRQLLGRLRYEQVNWSVELRELHNRRQLGAQGGVVPQGSLFETIYNRLGAEVRNPDARRQTIRNDLALTLRARLWRGIEEPLTVTTYWTSQIFRYRSSAGDTLRPGARTNRYGGRVEQKLRLGSHQLLFLVEGWEDRLRESTALPDTLGLRRRQVHATLRDSLHILGFDTIVDAGLHATDRSTFLGGAVHLSFGLGPLRLFAEGSHAGQPVSWIEEYGFGGYVEPVGTLPDGRVSQGLGGFTLRGGGLDLTAFAFLNEHTQPLDLYATAGEDTVQAVVAGEAFRRAGVGGDLGWRREARRGFYFVAQPTLVELLNAERSAEHDRVAASLPTFFIRGALGLRYVLFQRNLDLDLSLQGRFWSAFRSRTLHPPTGLLVVPEQDARRFGPSGTLDVIVKGGVRSATVFVAYENILSGTQLQVGTLLVPTYPLPQRHFRFGVFWPILN